MYPPEVHRNELETFDLPLLRHLSPPNQHQPEHRLVSRPQSKSFLAKLAKLLNHALPDPDNEPPSRSNFGTLNAALSHTKGLEVRRDSSSAFPLDQSHNINLLPSPPS